MKSNHKRYYNLLFIIGILGILDSLILLAFFSVSANLGVILPGIIGLSAVVFSLARLRNPGFLRIENRGVNKLLLGLVVIWAISFVVVESIIIISEHPDEAKGVDNMIILGAGLRGKELSLTLASRMSVGLGYLKSHPGIKVIVSGGQGPGEDITEAEAMEKFLVSQGIDAGRISKEEKSTSTIENFRLSKKLMSNVSGKYQVILVTSDFHMFRAKMLAKRVGLEPFGLPAKTPFYVLLNSYLREYFAVLKSSVLDR